MFRSLNRFSLLGFIAFWTGFMAVDFRLQADEQFPEIVGNSLSMRRVLDLVKKISNSDSSVLIQGESGVGKELIASAVHRLSLRAKKPMLAINCSAIPESLLESELFGYEKGAFTGADRRRSGYFEAANGGTIFLDEIGDMGVSLQTKLLRVLQEKKYTPLGGSAIRGTDVRIIAATNCDLEKEVRKGRKFRLDLYYRLNVLPIQVPPLRERREDIEPLLKHFLQHYNQAYDLKTPCFFHSQTLACLLRYPWPGNVRQLQNMVDRLTLTSSGGELCLEHLPPEFRGDEVEAAEISPNSGAWAVDLPCSYGNPGFRLSEHVRKFENSLILKALQATGNNKNRAAKILGLNRTTLVEKIKKRRLVLSDCS